MHTSPPPLLEDELEVEEDEVVLEDEEDELLAPEDELELDEVVPAPAPLDAFVSLTLLPQAPIEAARPRPKSAAKMKTGG